MEAHAFGTVGVMAHDDFAPDMPKGTKVVVIRAPHPHGHYDYEVAFVNPETKKAEFTALGEDDFDVRESR